MTQSVQTESVPGRAPPHENPPPSSEKKVGQCERAHLADLSSSDEEVLRQLAFLTGLAQLRSLDIGGTRGGGTLYPHPAGAGAPAGREKTGLPSHSAKSHSGGVPLEAVAGLVPVSVQGPSGPSKGTLKRKLQRARAAERKASLAAAFAPPPSEKAAETLVLRGGVPLPAVGQQGTRPTKEDEPQQAEKASGGGPGATEVARQQTADGERLVVKVGGKFQPLVFGSLSSRPLNKPSSAE